MTFGQPRQDRGHSGRFRRSIIRWSAAVCAAAVYLGTLMAAWPFPVGLLYDGLVPLPPYRWVHPPASRARDNKPALPGAGTVAMGPPSKAVEVATDDDQALATFAEGTIAARPGEPTVKVAIVPLDPVTVAPAPAERRFDGNAYRFEAVYAASGAPAVLASPVTIVLRYPVHATIVLRANGTGWEPLTTPQVFTGSQQILATTNRLGVFAAASIYNARRSDGPQGGPGVAALGAAVAGLLAAAIARRWT